MLKRWDRLFNGNADLDSGLLQKEKLLKKSVGAKWETMWEEDQMKLNWAQKK